MYVFAMTVGKKVCDVAFEVAGEGVAFELKVVVGCQEGESVCTDAANELGDEPDVVYDIVVVFVGAGLNVEVKDGE